jgi:transcriptional regulator with XRE-family HTH domain
MRCASKEAETMTDTPLTMTFEEVLAAEFERDPAFRLEWERTALARAVAVQIIAYRSANGLSQRALAALLEVKQPFVARLESGETNPGLETLMNISRATGIEFVISISRATRAPRLLSRRVRERSVSEESNGVSLLFSAA